MGIYRDVIAVVVVGLLFFLSTLMSYIRVPVLMDNMRAGVRLLRRRRVSQSLENSAAMVNLTLKPFTSNVPDYFLLATFRCNTNIPARRPDRGPGRRERSTGLPLRHARRPIVFDKVVRIYAK